MSTAQRRRGKSLHLELPGDALDERPPIAALFLIRFDVKAGYTIAWKQSISGLDIAESVEFKSLPSGLHNVSEDLVYFIHDDEYAGISAFINKSTEQWERNALMLSVGALVPLDQGRLGRCWKHADALKKMAEYITISAAEPNLLLIDDRELVLDLSQIQILEEYWASNCLSDNPKAPRREVSLSPNRQSGGRTRSKSNASALGPSSLGLSSYHPALSLPSMIDTFGPLIYPLYKAAILRKRILLQHEAPVWLSCNFVYDVSILSNIPSSVADLIPLDPLPSRLQPLFSVGVHDIDDLSSRGKVDANDPFSGYGWVACSTDDVLGMKKDLYDTIATVPPLYTHRATEKAWPSLRTSKGEEIRASQRDLRRYRTLRQSLRTQAPRSRSASPFSSRSRNISETPMAQSMDSDRLTLLANENAQETFDDASSATDEKLIEPMSWSALAYNSFMWWASAGEKRTDFEEEAEQDAAMFRDFNSANAIETPLNRSGPNNGVRRRSSSGRAVTSMGIIQPMMTDGSNAAPEMAIIAYFHRLTAVIFSTLARLVENSDADRLDSDRDEDGNDEQASDIQGTEQSINGGTRSERKDEPQGPPVFIGSDDMIRMGLDVWSEGDRRFVEELLNLYWGRKADVQGGRIECCGVRIL